MLGPSSTSNVTRLLLQWSQGDTAAREALIPLVYQELRRIARQCLASQRPDHTLQSTALVHEAYLRLVDRSSVHWENRVHFFAVAAQLMRRILVDHARKQR
ncbi:MAG: RNA polymerase subunit sigma-70, partial [Acidobacteria bacterium]